MPAFISNPSIKSWKSAAKLPRSYFGRNFVRLARTKRRTGASSLSASGVDSAPSKA